MLQRERILRNFGVRFRVVFNSDQVRLWKCWRAETMKRPLRNTSRRGCGGRLVGDGNRSDRRFPNLSCPWALEADELSSRRRANFHQGQEHKIKLPKEAECMVAIGPALNAANASRSGLGPYRGRALRRLVCTFIAAFARMRSIQASNDRQSVRLHSRRRSHCATTGAANRTITVEEFQWKSVP
jgi:hypothetical protein